MSTWVKFWWLKAEVHYSGRGVACRHLTQHTEVSKGLLQAVLTGPCSPEQHPGDTSGVAGP